MPRRKVKLATDHYYHVFNRGIDKRIIFADHEDYATLLEIIAYYLKKTNTVSSSALKRTGLRFAGILKDKVDVLTYCLMPNHYHLLLRQVDDNGISDFMRRITQTYTMYFNRKHERSGPLFQGRFRAKHIDTNEYLLQSSKYIHLNPKDLVKTTSPGLVGYRWSSFGEYAKQSTNIVPLKTKTILDFYDANFKPGEYVDFVLNFPKNDYHESETLAFIK